MVKHQKTEVIHESPELIKKPTEQESVVFQPANTVESGGGISDNWVKALNGIRTTGVS